MRKTIIFSFMLLTAGLQVASQDTNTVVVNGLLFRAFLNNAPRLTSPELNEAASQNTLRSPGISPENLSPEMHQSASFASISSTTPIDEALVYQLLEHCFDETEDRREIAKEYSNDLDILKFEKNKSFQKINLKKQKPQGRDCSNDFPFNHETIANRRDLFPDLQ